MHGADGINVANIAASSAGQSLLGGVYMLVVSFTGSGTVGVDALSPDGTTWVPVSINGPAGLAGSLAANGAGYCYLAAGTYRISVATATAVYAALNTVPF
jgi:hypothetical protein